MTDIAPTQKTIEGKIIKSIPPTQEDIIIPTQEDTQEDIIIPTPMDGQKTRIIDISKENMYDDVKIVFDINPTKKPITIEGIITGFTDINFDENKAIDIAIKEKNATAIKKGKKIYKQIEILKQDGKTITVGVTTDNYEAINDLESNATGVSSVIRQERKKCQERKDRGGTCTLSGGRKSRKSKNVKKHRKRRTVRHRQHKRKQ